MDTSASHIASKLHVMYARVATRMGGFPALVAQWLEHHSYKVYVDGSTPSWSTGL